MKYGTVENWPALAQLGYFEPLEDGRLKLIVDGLDGLIDFHTHLGWTFLLAPAPDFMAKTPAAEHNFGRDIPVDLNIYSGQNFFGARARWPVEDYLFQCLLSPIRFGKHLTHTIPNLISEMDALKIDSSVCLAIDLLSMSSNSEHAARLLARQNRLVFYASVHPEDNRAREKLTGYLDSGAMGLKIHPAIQMIHANSNTLIRFLKLWKRISGGLPVLFHSGSNGNEPRHAIEYSDIRLYEPAADALGDAPCILGHAAMNEFRLALDIAEKYPNVYLEVSGQPPRHIREMIDHIGDERLLFGSDWPVYPQAMPMAKVLLATEDAPQSRIRILRDNALHILNLSRKIVEDRLSYNI
jgi:uncharacterized protein